MNNNRLSIIYIRLFRPILHFSIIVLCFYMVYRLRLYTDLIPFVQLRVPYMNYLETMIFAFFSGFIFVFMGFFYGIYELFKPIHGYFRKFLNVWLVFVIVISFVAYFGYEFIFESGISRFVLIVGSFYSLLILSLFDLILNSINSFFEKKNPYKILFIYTNKNFYLKIHNNLNFYSIYKIRARHLLEANKNMDLLISQNDIIITIGNIDKNTLQKIVDISRIKDKTYYHISSSYFLEDLIYRMARLGPIMVFQLKPSPLDGRFRVLKRIFDVIFSMFFIIFFSWLYLIVAIYIYFKDGFPIIYKSERVGKFGKKFFMYKFRTMIKNAEKYKEQLLKQSSRKGPLFKLENDPRIPLWGKLLRKTSIDEIPQFFNILKGEMSVVGPRPHLEEEVKKYQGWQKRLLSIKPGITGYAQIFGRDKLDFDEEAKLDLYYIQNRNLFLDVYVIFLTMKVIFDGK